MNIIIFYAMVLSNLVLVYLCFNWGRLGTYVSMCVSWGVCVCVFPCVLVRGGGGVFPCVSVGGGGGMCFHVCQLGGRGCVSMCVSWGGEGLGLVLVGGGGGEGGFCHIEEC